MNNDFKTMILISLLVGLIDAGLMYAAIKILKFLT